MVITMTLSNNKGISLVVLVVAMTLIAILGTSFVALMSSKQKGFLYQVDSYRALNLANAGVEYAIRYVSDGLSDTTNPSNNFFSNSNATVTRGFAGGTFNFTYNHINNRILVTGIYPDTNPLSRRDVMLSNFRRYLSPISLKPDGLTASIPQRNLNDIDIPTMSNNDIDFTVTRIDVSIITNTNMYLNILREGTAIFSNSGSVPYAPCLPTPIPICYNLANGIYTYSGNYTYRFDLTSPNPNHVMDSTHIYTLHFSGPPPPGLYRIDFYTSLSITPYTIRFII
jgi:hypothetical protein